jgi:hypothetical protein
MGCCVIESCVPAGADKAGATGQRGLRLVGDLAGQFAVRGKHGSGVLGQLLRGYGASSRTRSARSWRTSGRAGPAPADAGGVPVLAIWGQTQAGRRLIVVLRQTEVSHDWLIVGAMEMTAEQAAEYDRWEADREQ